MRKFARKQKQITAFKHSNKEVTKQMKIGGMDISFLIGESLHAARTLAHLNMRVYPYEITKC